MVSTPRPGRSALSALTLNSSGREEIFGNLGGVQPGEFINVLVGPDVLLFFLVVRTGLVARTVDLDHLVGGVESLEHALDLVRGGGEKFETKVRSSRSDQGFIEGFLLVTEAVCWVSGEFSLVRVTKG